MADVKCYSPCDHGNTWTQYHKSNYRYFNVKPLSNENCLLFGQGTYTGGDFGAWRGAVWQTTNSGNNWIESKLVDLQSIRSSSFYSATEAYCAANRKLIKLTVK